MNSIKPSNEQGMGKVLGSIEAQFSGKVGDKVYYKHRGVACVRKAPAVKRDARTPGQLLNQQRFKQINLFCRQFMATPVLRTWKDAAVNTTGYQLFIKANAPAFNKQGEVQDYKLIHLTTGPLPLPFEMMVQREGLESNTMQVSWKQDFHFSGERLRDELKVIAQYNGVFSAIQPTGLTRRSGGGSFELPVGFEAAGTLYLFFVSTDYRDYSNSCAFVV